MTFPASQPYSNLISKAIEQLRFCSQVNIQASWQCWESDQEGALSKDLLTGTNLFPAQNSLRPAPSTPLLRDPSALLPDNARTPDLNAKGHIAWSGGQRVLWLAQRLVIPQDLQGYPLAGLSLRLALTWWAEAAQIYVNGVGVQEGDLFDCSVRVLLSPAVTPGEEITVALRLVSPSHDDGALVRSLCVYESSSDSALDPGFVADELAVLQRYLETFAPVEAVHESYGNKADAVSGEESISPRTAPEYSDPASYGAENLTPGKRPRFLPPLQTLAQAVAEIDWAALPDRQKFERSLLQVRSSLEFLNDGLRQRRIQLLGHAHLDLAWLWPISETWDVAQRTFASVLKLQQEFPELTFCHSTPALYAWIEEHRPDLFTAIQLQVAAGRWEVVGGLWVEPELNLIAGESIVRQLLYGQRYVLEKFGNVSTVAWLPDSFGFSATLPQFLASGGIEYFVTQKLRWNDTTKFPYGAFWWRAPDGTELFSLMSAPIGEGIAPVKMADYACDWETQTNLQDALWLPGVGDHGGGPTRDMLEVQKRWQQSPFFPRLEFTTAEGYLQHIKARGSAEERAEVPSVERTGVEGRGDKGETTVVSSLSPHLPISPSPHLPIYPLSPEGTPSSPSPHLPIWEDELYLEFHRGCYTTHADQKRWNRRCEGLLYQAELFASLATLSAGVAYPKAELEAAWKKVLFNQFHDILPGSSIPQVYIEANQAWREVEQVGAEILQQSLRAIASQIAFSTPPYPDAQPIVVFNPLNWERSEVVEIIFLDLEKEQSFDWQICDLEGYEVKSQGRFLEPRHTSSGEKPVMSVSFVANNIPSIGYRVFWLCPCKPSLRSCEPPPEEFVLENEMLRVTIDPLTGDLSSVFDKTNQREVLIGPGNQLQAFRDSGQYWDAWNIDPNYAQHALPPAELLVIHHLERGALRTRVRVVRKIGQSSFNQDYILQAGSPVLKIATTVDWQERHVLVKAAFPLNLEADYATYEIPCGAIGRPTQPKTPVEQAKWEVPALRWADLSAGGYGVSLLNDCKYGYDSKLNQLRLTLLRSTSWPDPQADKGFHEFTYALYPHGGSWQSAHTVRQGYELNLPLQVMLLPPISSTTSGKLPPVGRLLDLSAENLILMAFKQSEDDPQQWILRCYECHGETAQLNLQSDLGLAIAHPIDLLERPIKTPETSPSIQACNISPWKIATFSIKPSVRKASASTMPNNCISFN